MKTIKDLIPAGILNEHELSELKAGYSSAYGCQSNVCSLKRSGAASLCQDAYCRSGVGPESGGGKHDREMH